MRMYDKSTDVFYSLSVQYGRCILEVCDICVWDPYVDTSGAFSTNLAMLMFVVLIFEVSQPAAPIIIVRMSVVRRFIVLMFAERIFVVLIFQLLIFGRLVFGVAKPPALKPPAPKWEVLMFA